MKTYSRLTKIIEGTLIVGQGIKCLANKVKKARQAKADKIVDGYIKNNADFERYQREMLYYHRG